ncbi:MAG: hypothetical protein EON91_12655 [Brevundimonas sp.]|uniref:hypothetical protein n=1 Tax=Brevundimonas sp. TaxID=1871086 RepID=UPI00120F25B3|nr:hypothetical protein [Brevundimonas sp.]RZJ16579.1 MAG: hypothetical protein EON91_12655 [Brevundimonas sp.]
MRMLLAAAAVAALIVPASAMAMPDTTLNVSTNVADYCSIQLANVAGSNVSVANGNRQKVSTLRLACNDPQGAVLTSSFKNGDFFGLAANPGHPTGHNTVNYDWELVVAAPAASLGFSPQDTYPGGPAVISNAPYSQGLANGVLADFFLNLCYSDSAQGPNPPQEDPQDPGIGSSGCTGSVSEALAAPADTYSETFYFDLNPA